MEQLKSLKLMANRIQIMPSTHQSLLLKSAITSRLLLIFLILLWRTLFPPYDTSSPLDPPCLSSPLAADRPAVSFPRISSSLESSVVWDSVYFIRISRCLYEYEQSFAFYPLLPLLMAVLSHTVFAPLIPLIGLRAVLVLAGYVINNAAFVLAAFYMYRVSVLVLKDADFALRASIFFCFNPASIFYSSIYSESLYALFSLGGLNYVISGASNIAVLWFALSGCARSNGMVNAGYFCFQTMHQAYDAVFVKKRAFLAVQVLIVGALRCICTFLPFIAFQAYGYYNICVGTSLDEMSPWCKAKIPLLYNYIQSRYWGVGFLRYFQFKQLPNFLLASPVLSLALFSILYYVRSQPEMFFSLGFNSEKKSVPPLSPQDSVSGSNSSHPSERSPTKVQENRYLRQRKPFPRDDNHPSTPEECNSVENTSIFIVPCTLHLVFLAATAFFIMHVQVATRFLSACPPLYWFASYLFASPGTSRKWGYMIWAYSAAYILLGSLLFSNFYPFT